MTDKQIIDITQCPFYREGKVCTYLPYESKCEGSCLWTEYKEKESQIELLEEENDELNDIISQLKAELEQEKALKETYLTCYKAKHGDIKGRLFTLEETVIKIKVFIQKEIDYFGHDIEYQYDWKELMKLIEASEVQDGN